MLKGGLTGHPCRTATDKPDSWPPTKKTVSRRFHPRQQIGKISIVGIGLFACHPEQRREKSMNMNDMMADIRDANLSYLMLAQQLVRADRAMAIFRLGISIELAELIDNLSPAQIVKLASSSMMLTRFRFDDAAVLGMLTSHSKERALTQVHATILMAAQPVEEIG
jgi:flagellar transcriptional activator FlhD